jgi:hypothetical protein
VNKKSNGGGTFSQSTLCACMEIPQWNSSVQLLNIDK